MISLLIPSLHPPALSPHHSKSNSLTHTANHVIAFGIKIQTPYLHHKSLHAIVPATATSVCTPLFCSVRFRFKDVFSVPERRQILSHISSFARVFVHWYIFFALNSSWLTESAEQIFVEWMNKCCSLLIISSTLCMATFFSFFKPWVKASTKNSFPNPLFK